MSAARIARLIVLLICLTFGIGNAVWGLLHWDPRDIDAYLNAAMRLREGEPLYAPLTDINSADVYRYAPWFAVVWIPLTFLPKAIVEVAWSVLLLAACVAVVLPVLMLRRPAAIAFGTLVGSFLIVIASRGNVQPLMIAALVYGVERRSGPLWIALCASLKATPILFAGVYLLRGQYVRALIAGAITLALVAPMLLANPSSYPTDPGITHSLWSISPLVFWVVAIAVIAGGAIVARRTPVLGWLAASTATIMSLPRAFAYDITFLFVGTVPAVPRWRRDSEDEVA